MHNYFCDHCGAALDPGEICDCKQQPEESERRIVTYSDWEAAGDFSKAAQPGDYVEERIVDDMRDVLPPAKMERGFLQVGEPYSHEFDPETGHWRGTFPTFVKEGQNWKYCGNCFIGKTTPPPGTHPSIKEGSEKSKTLYFEGAGWSGADSSKATIGNCRIRTAFHLDPEKKHPRCSCGEPHDGAAAVYLEIICGTIGKENRKLGLEPTYYGWIDYLHYVTDDDRNDDCNRHILPFERRARIDYTLESILKFVNDLGASFDAVAVCPDFGGYRVFRDGYSPKGTERLNYGDEFQCDPDMTARREAVYRHVYELEKAEGSRYPNFSLWVDQDDPGMPHLLRHFSGTFKTAHNTHWTIRTDTGSTVEDWMATATVTPLGRYGC